MIGLPDAEWGERVVAVIVAKGVAPLPEELDARYLNTSRVQTAEKTTGLLETLPKNKHRQGVEDGTAQSGLRTVAMFDGFETRTLTSTADIFARIGGNGPPLLLSARLPTIAP